MFIVRYCQKSFNDAVNSDHKTQKFDELEDAAEFSLANNHPDWKNFIDVRFNERKYLTLEYKNKCWVAYGTRAIPVDI
ncbi:MAG: hypothetical protein ACRDBG_00810 [Waterburya sp.]